MAVPMKIKELPFSAIWELCRYLDNPNLLHHSGWRGLLSRAPGKIYNALDVSAFERVGQRPNGSPTEAVIQDFITRGFTVDELYIMLTGIEHTEGQRALQDYVSPYLLEAQEDPIQLPPAEVPDPLAPSHDVHPRWGPLPDDPPPVVPRGPYLNPSQRSTVSSSTSPRNFSMLTTLPASHNGVGLVRATEDCADLQVETIQNGIKAKMDPRWGGMESGNAQVTGTEGAYHQNSNIPTQLPNGTGKTLTVDGTTASPASHQYAPHSTPPSAPTRSSDLPRHNYSQESTQVQSSAGVLHHTQAPSSDRTHLSESKYQLPPSATQYPVTAKAVQASLGRQEAATLPQAYAPQLPNMAYSRPLTSTSTNSSEYSSDSTFYSDGVPRPLSEVTSSYTSSDQSDHSLLPGQIRPPIWAESSPASPMAASNVDILMLTPNILSFSFTELSKATGDFTQGIIGLGTFGTVFKAKIRGNGPFAIKKLHNESEMEGGMFYGTFHQVTFTQELQLLTKYNHRNILSLVAYSNDGPRPCLVYEYMENGSLAECLLGKRRVSLLWRDRLEIANQVADALHFLHTVNQPKCLVHGDVKSANILLDAHLVPKLSDFGLARECHRKPNQKSTYSMQSKVMGTMAYMAPEFIRNRKLTPKTDVYSFGVVLLELYTGLAADDPTLEEKRILTQRLVHLFENTNEREVASLADVRAAWPQDVGFDLFVIATVCLRKKAKDRPHMDQVRAQLGHSSPELDSSEHQLPDPPAYSVANHHPGDGGTDIGGRRGRWQ